MSNRFLRLGLVATALLPLLTFTCLAQEITTVTVTANCSGFTIRALGEGVTQPTKLSYAMNLKPSSGATLRVKHFLQVKPQSNGEFRTSESRLWSDFGLAIDQKANYRMAGQATLGTAEKTVQIVFSPTSFSCRVTTNACLPTSSLAVLLQGSKVTSYVPNGAWSDPTTGLQVVPLEGGGAPVAVTTPNTVNSCSSNSTTGQTVCTANNTDVYLLSGSTLNSTLTSGADTLSSFSGGSCYNCGVAVNNATNQAVLTIGLSSSPSLSGVQFLDLATNTFQTPLIAYNQIAEDISWDPNRNLILSPNEFGVFDIFQTTPSFGEFGNAISGAPIMDSAAEDCTTGIALASVEFSDQIYVTDLNQAKFTPGLPGTWTGAGQLQTFPEFAGFGAGTSGIAVAPGTHLGIVSDEFGGNQFGVFSLPSTSGSGIPSITDYVQAALPITPDGLAWAHGLDPHTVTAYQSPNDGKAYALLANYPPPTYLAVVDIQALLNAPRLPGTHYVDPAYDMVVNGIVRYVATH